MGGLGGEAPQPPEAEILKIEINPPLNKEVFEGCWGGYSVIEGTQKFRF